MKTHFPNAVFIDTTVEDFSQYGFVMCGGGGLFIRGVLPPWERPPSVPFGLIGIGAEFPHQADHALNLLEEAQFLFVRDSHSLSCMKLPEACLSCDIAFSSPARAFDGQQTDHVLFVWRDLDELLAFSDFRSYIGTTAHKSEWRKMLDRQFSSVLEADFNTPGGTLEASLRGVGFVVSARYHGIVAAIQSGIPCIGIDVSPKIKQLMHESHLRDYCLKIGDLGKLPSAIHHARRNWQSIRNRENEFTHAANRKVLGHIATARNAIDAALSRM